MKCPARGTRRSITSRWRAAWARTCPSARRSFSRPTEWRARIGGLPAPGSAGRARGPPGRIPSSGPGGSGPQPAPRAARAALPTTSCSATTKASWSEWRSCWTRAAAPPADATPGHRRARRRIRHAEPPGPHRPRDLPARPPAPPARRYRQAAPRPPPAPSRSGDYVVHLDHGIGIYRGIEHDRGRRSRPRGGGRGVRGRRPAQRAALPARSAGALPRRR